MENKQKIYLLAAGAQKADIDHALLMAEKRGLELILVDSKKDVPEGYTAFEVPRIINIEINPGPIPNVYFETPKREREYQPWRDKNRKRYHG